MLKLLSNFIKRNAMDVITLLLSLIPITFGLFGLASWRNCLCGIAFAVLVTNYRNLQLGHYAIITIASCVVGVMFEDSAFALISIVAGFKTIRSFPFKAFRHRDMNYMNRANQLIYGASLVFAVYIGSVLLTEKLITSGTLMSLRITFMEIYVAKMMFLVLMVFYMIYRSIAFYLMVAAEAVVIMIGIVTEAVNGYGSDTDNLLILIVLSLALLVNLGIYILNRIGETRNEKVVTET